MKKLSKPQADQAYWLLWGVSKHLDKVTELAFVGGLDGLVDDIGDLQLEIARIREDVGSGKAVRRLSRGCPPGR